MPAPAAHSPRCPQEGAITIMVALLMLVLLTISALAMSRDSFQDIVSTGFARQGGMAREVSNSGIEWVLYWMDPGNAPNTANAVNLATQMTTLRQTPSMAGVPYNIVGAAVQYAPGTPLQPDMMVSNPNTGVSQGFTIGLTQMGQPDVTNASQGVGQGQYSPAGQKGTAGPQPILWAIRSDAQVTQGPVTFTHGTEVWVTTGF